MSDLGNKAVMASNIKKYMEQNGVDSKKVCDDLSIPPSTFSNWINGKIYPRIDKIELLANYFDITKSDLVEREKPLEHDFIITDKDEQYIIEVYRRSSPIDKKVIRAYFEALFSAKYGKQKGE